MPSVFVVFKRKNHTGRQAPISLRLSTPTADRRFPTVIKRCARLRRFAQGATRQTTARCRRHPMADTTPTPRIRCPVANGLLARSDESNRQAPDTTITRAS